MVMSRIFKLVVLLSLIPTFSLYAQIDDGIVTNFQHVLDGEFSDEAYNVLSLPDIEFNPTFPEPLEEFTASFATYNQKIQGAKHLWAYDTIEVVGGEGRGSVKLVAPAVGDSSEVAVLFTYPNGSTEVIRKTITPKFVDIILEPQTHVPGFYLGRPLARLGSVVNATAIIQDEDPDDLVYKWRAGLKVIGQGAAVGNPKVSFDAPRDQNIFVKLEVSRVDGTQIADEIVVLPSVVPFINFYESSSLLGLNEKPLENKTSMIGSTMVVRAEPYYLDSRVFNDPSILEWEIGNQSYDNSGRNPYEVTLERRSATGVARLNFHVRSTDVLLQGAEANLNITL